MRAYLSLEETKDNRRRTPPSMVFRTSSAFYRTPIISLPNILELLNYWHYLLHRLVSFVFLPKIYCIVDCCMAMQQLLCRHAAIALSRCSNELPSRNRATERIKKAVISLLSGKSTEPKVDDSQGAKDHRRSCSPPALTFSKISP